MDRFLNPPILEQVGPRCRRGAEIGRLAGAALDVMTPEPLPADHPLWDCGNLLLTPHVGGGDRMEGTVRRIAAIALENLKRYRAGKPLLNRMK